ncbi:hypothetical protein HK104_001792 [Borealophlyctis nickersoniae]|nr:hypothetical protein HK104_001792 [Borealophlyctis nickersoniae]
MILEYFRPFDHWDVRSTPAVCHQDIAGHDHPHVKLEDNDSDSFFPVPPTPSTPTTPINVPCPSPTTPTTSSAGRAGLRVRLPSNGTIIDEGYSSASSSTCELLSPMERVSIGATTDFHNIGAIMSPGSPTSSDTHSYVLPSPHQEPASFTDEYSHSHSSFEGYGEESIPSLSPNSPASYSVSPQPASYDLPESSSAPHHLNDDHHSSNSNNNNTSNSNGSDLKPIVTTTSSGNANGNHGRAVPRTIPPPLQINHNHYNNQNSQYYHDNSNNHNTMYSPQITNQSMMMPGPMSAPPCSMPYGDFGMPGSAGGPMRSPSIAESYSEEASFGSFPSAPIQNSHTDHFRAHPTPALLERRRMSAPARRFSVCNVSPYSTPPSPLQSHHRNQHSPHPTSPSLNRRPSQPVLSSSWTPTTAYFPPLPQPTPQPPKAPINYVFVQEDPSQQPLEIPAYIDPETGATIVEGCEVNLDEEEDATFVLGVGAKFKCECGKLFEKLVNLKAHARLHRAERNHICEVCQRAFMRRQDLRRHRSMHMSGFKPWECDHCHTTFTRSDALHRHIKAKRCL